MAKPKPPKPSGRKCPPHQWKFPAVTNDHIEHECKKCGVKTKRPKGKNGKAAAAAALIVAALIPLSAAKCGTGTHAGLPVHTRNWWIQNLPPEDYIVFGGQKPLGEWEQQGWVRRPPGSRQPRARVWVQK